MTTPDHSRLAERVVVLAPTAKDAQIAETVLSRVGVACTFCPNLPAVCRGKRRESEPFSHDDLEVLWSSDHSVSSSTSAMRFARLRR